MENTTTGKTFPSDIIVEFLFNTVYRITRELDFGNIWKLQEKLNVNAQMIRIPCSQIIHTPLIYNTPKYVNYNLLTCKLPNNGINYGFVVHYPTRDTYQQMKNSDQKHKSVKYEFDTMVKVNNQLNKKIDLTVDNNYLKGIKQGTLEFRKLATLVVLQHPFNTFGRATLGYEYQND